MGTNCRLPGTVPLGNIKGSDGSDGGPDSNFEAMMAHTRSHPKEDKSIVICLRTEPAHNEIQL